MKIVILTCIVAGFIARLSSERIIQASELPTNTLLPESKIRELQEAVKNGSLPMGPREARSLFDTLRRRKRADTDEGGEEEHGGDDSVSKAWCCQMPRPNTTVREPMAKSRMVEKLVPAGGTEKCGFAGWNRCTSGTQTKITIIEYYNDYQYISVPSKEWESGCPESKIVCCAGYIYRTKSANCLTWTEYANMIKLQMQYCHTDFGILDTFTPMPYTMACPTVS